MFSRKKKESKNLIEFSCSPYEEGIPKPVPASKVVPTWWKDMDRHIPEHPNLVHVNGGIPGAGIPPQETVKACVPVLDTLRTGYIIPLWTELIFAYPDHSPNDLMISWNFQGLGTKLHGSYLEESRDRRAVDPKSFESSKGMPIHNRALENNVPHMFTLNSPWMIKTPPGYSCLFIAPLNNDLPFDYVNGIVNTDTYTLAVNWNFIMKRRWEGTLRVGTPMMQVIPFKRDEWESTVRTWTDEDVKRANIAMTGLDMYFEGGYQRNHGCPVRHS